MTVATGQLRKYSRSKGLLGSQHSWCYHPSPMDSLPNIHDHSLLEYRVDLANRRITFVTLPEEGRLHPDTKPLIDHMLKFVRRHGLEGVAAKRSDSVYESGRRSRAGFVPAKDERYSGGEAASGSNLTSLSG